MKKKFLPLIFFPAVILLAGCSSAPVDQGQTPPQKQQPASINSFEECAKAGNPIMETFPPQCRTEDGRTFTQTTPPELKDQPPVTNKPANGDAICKDTCGDGTCQEIVCMGSGCPCAETAATCPEDCGEEAEPMTNAPATNSATPETEPTSNVPEGWELY